MRTTTQADREIKNIFCPTDLSERSQRALGLSVRLAEKLHTSLTVCHCAHASWFTQENGLPDVERVRINDAIRTRIEASHDQPAKLSWRNLLIENSFDPARDIVSSSRELGADLIVMKARPGLLSAFRFGSIVERVIERAACPVLLLPSKFLETHDPSSDDLGFKNILFDYDFSMANEQLFQVATDLMRNYHADLRMISVIEPPGISSGETAVSPSSRTAVQTLMRRKLDEVLQTGGHSIMDVPTTVEWGRHAETVLRHAEEKRVDLICTALAPTNLYLDKVYSSYLGRLLRSTSCPILVKQSARTDSHSIPH